MSVCSVGLTRELVQNGENVITVIYDTMDLILVLELTFLGSLVLKSCPTIDMSLREAFQIMEEERLARKKENIYGKPIKHLWTSQPSLSSVPKEDVDDIVARFFYADGFNIKVVNSPYFLEMLKAIAAFGLGYEPPTKDKLSDTYLSKEK